MRRFISLPHSLEDTLLAPFKSSRKKQPLIHDTDLLQMLYSGGAVSGQENNFSQPPIVGAARRI
jgi:hypothetical protein